MHAGPGKRSNARMDILLLPGDDIGPEIAGSARRALEALDRAMQLDLRLSEAPIGFATLQSRGTTFPDEVLAAARAADGVVLGPVGTYAYPSAAEGGINPSASTRVALDLYANIRPARTWPGVPALAPSMDLVVVRENTEGFYADRNMFLGSGEFQPTPDVALAVRKITREGSTRIARAGLELARRRRRKLTVVHKANVLRVSDGLFLECVHAAAAAYPDVAVDEMIVDAMSARLVRTPEAFDVIVTTNMFGDILSDEAAELAGGLGLAGALNAGAEHALAQATHGSAPDIAGRGIANPSALLLSCAMLLEWLGARHARDALSAAASRLEAAVGAALADPGSRTPDLGGRATTAAFTDAVLARL